MRALGQFSLGLLSLSDSGHELLQLSLQFLPLVFRLRLGLLQALDLAGQLLVGNLLALLGLLQVGLELDMINNKTLAWSDDEVVDFFNPVI